MVGVSSSFKNQSVGALQLGPDKRIYLAINSESWLSAITQPNNSGTACNFVDQFITLQQSGISPSPSLLGLPQSVPSFLPNNNIAPLQIEANNFCFGNTTLFDLNDSSGINAIIWNFGDSSSNQNTSMVINTGHLFSSQNTFYVTAIVSKECKTDTLTETVVISDCEGTEQQCKVNVPNVFTPNNDLLNDQFYVGNNCTFSKYNVKIFNRWGNIVFESDNPHEKWDGQTKEGACSEGVYFYLLEYENPGLKNQLLSGFLSIIK